MHFLATDLDFDPCIFIVNNRRVQRFVAVALGSRDIILEPTGDHFVALMDDTEGPIALFRPFRTDAEGPYVGKLFKADLPFLHLFPTGIGMLLASRNGYLPAPFAHQLSQDRRRSGPYNMSTIEET